MKKIIIARIELESVFVLNDEAKGMFDEAKKCLIESMADEMAKKSKDLKENDIIFKELEIEE